MSISQKKHTMKITNILYSKTFPHPVSGQWEKIALEAEVTPDEDIKICLYSLKKQIENFHYESKGSDDKKAAEIVRQPDTPQSTEARIIAQILQCEYLETDTKKGISGLDSFKLLAGNNKAIKAAYDMQELILRNKK